MTLCCLHCLPLVCFILPFSRKCSWILNSYVSALLFQKLSFPDHDPSFFLFLPMQFWNGRYHPWLHRTGPCNLNRFQNHVRGMEVFCHSFSTDPPIPNSKSVFTEPSTPICHLPAWAGQVWHWLPNCSVFFRMKSRGSQQITTDRVRPLLRGLVPRSVMNEPSGRTAHTGDKNHIGWYTRGHHPSYPLTSTLLPRLAWWLPCS